MSELILQLDQHELRVPASEMPGFINGLTLVELGNKSYLFRMDDRKYILHHKRAGLRFAYSGKKWQVPKKRFDEFRRKCEAVISGENRTFGLGWMPVSAVASGETIVVYDGSQK
jgi:hypothetical protein